MSANSTRPRCARPARPTPRVRSTRVPRLRVVGEGIDRTPHRGVINVSGFTYVAEVFPLDEWWSLSHQERRFYSHNGKAQQSCYLPGLGVLVIRYGSDEERADASSVMNQAWDLEVEGGAR